MALRREQLVSAPPAPDQPLLDRAILCDHCGKPQSDNDHATGGPCRFKPRVICGKAVSAADELALYQRAIRGE